MRLDRRLASVATILLAPALMRCEPGEAGPPPATAQNTLAPAPTEALPAGPAPALTSTPGGAHGPEAVQYASGEYALGQDTADGYDDTDPAALTDFREPLQPYGTWSDDPTYGTVWTPSTTVVGADFKPYVTAGHWAYDDDWVWMSDYPWGWAPFHYGRWVLLERRGWAWVPGREYRGAWVVWSVDDGYTYLGWAAAPPAFLWFGGVAVGWNVYTAPRWVYCPRREVFEPAVAVHVVAGAAAGPIAPRMRPYVPAVPHVAAGPPLDRLGLNAAQVPHPEGAGAGGVMRAQQFGRPSTALPLGAHPSVRTWPDATMPAGVARTAGAGGGRPSLFTSAASATSPKVGGPPSQTASPSAGQWPVGTQTAPTVRPLRMPTAPATVPAFRGSSPSVRTQQPAVQPAPAVRVPTPAVRPAAPAVAPHIPAPAARGGYRH